MQTYRVKMNNSKAVGHRYDPDAPKGVRFFHVCSDSIAGALKMAEQQFAGECESVTVKQLGDPDFKVSEMQEYVNYEIMSAQGSPNDTIIFRKNCQKILVTIRGGEFLERGETFWFKLSILDIAKNIDMFESAPFFTLRILETLSFEIYSIVKEKQIPAIFSGQMDEINISELSRIGKF